MLRDKVRRDFTRLQGPDSSGVETSDRFKERADYPGPIRAFGSAAQGRRPGFSRIPR